ncbi:DnaJ protein, putative [Hepatocystis sp. ex Piliocolobus tephrosceles]|nr:DnaJ protein, putative [Hepatocystis sp. ex Piliocolobus tephrosceles]
MERHQFLKIHKEKDKARDKEKVKEKKEINEFMPELDSNTIFSINSMSNETKNYFLTNYIAKIQYLTDNSINPSYYEVLNVDINTDIKHIRKSYLLLSKLFNVNKKLPNEHKEYYYLIQKAYNVLTDKFEKFYYDVINNHIVNGRLIEEQRKALEEEADIIYKNRIEELNYLYNKKLEEESEKNGLIIEKALYGNVTIKKQYINTCLDIESINEKHLEGPYIDLTTILQSKIENSSLLFNDDFSFAYFCDVPKPLIKISNNYEKQKTANSYINLLTETEMYLYVRYKFLNIYHECIIIDRANYSLPQSTHRVFGNHILGPFSPVNITKMQHLPNSFFDKFFHFFAKNKFYITLLTTIILCAQSVKSR